MKITIQGAREHNLQGVDAVIGDGLTVVTGVSGSGKTSLVFDTLYHEARRRFMEIYSVGATAARLLPAEVESITGLGPAVAVGQNLLNRNPNSIMATASGLHPFFRLLFAHYSQRLCARCGQALTVLSEDELVERLVALAERDPLEVSAVLLRGVPGSHRTLLEMLSQRFDRKDLLLDGAPWRGDPAQAGLSHDLDLRLGVLVSGITALEARPLVAQAAGLGIQALKLRSGEAEEIVSRAPLCSACGTWFGDLRPVHFNATCPHCNGKGCERCFGAGLPPEAAAARWNGLRFTELLSLSVEEALLLFRRAGLPASAGRLQEEITRRLQALQRVGLGYVGLDRSSPTLSRGEAQRVRLALALISRLEDLLHVLDEPTVGQHPADVQRLLPAFRELPGPVVFVEHDRFAAAGADQALDLGPGAGRFGGQVIFSGSPKDLWQADTPSGRYFSLRQQVASLPARPAPVKFLSIQGANLRTLKDIDVTIPLERLTVVTGISGSGKSSLVEDVLVASLEAGHPVGCKCLVGEVVKPVLVDQSPIGRNPRSNPATYTKLSDSLRDLFAAASGLSASHFSFNRPEGACPECQGLGAIEVAMRYLPSTWIACGECGGMRFTDEVLAVRLSFADGIPRSIAEVYAMPVDELLPLLHEDRHLNASKRSAAVRILQALVDIGLGYIPLGQPSPSLSGGEAQRVKLARYLGRSSLRRQLLVLDEPTTGLHPQDLAGLLKVLDRLVRHGATVVIVEHNTDVIRHADWVIDLGPGAGPQGGQLLYAGPPESLSKVAGSQTAQALRQEALIQPLPLAGSGSNRPDTVISIRGAAVHNLKKVNVDIPKGSLTVVTGVSGSGKSSLISDVLEAEARRRYLETLSMYERQGTREGAEAEVEAVSGLGVALTITPERVSYQRRATVGTASEIVHHLSVLLAASEERRCLDCGAQMQRLDHALYSGSWSCPSCQAVAVLARPQHFHSATYSAACLKCNGIGSLLQPNPAKLIIHPEKPLVEGAMYSPGFFPNGYLGKPFNHGYYLVLALGERFGFDPHRTPWNEMSLEAQQAFLYGHPEELLVHALSRTGRAATHRWKFPGFYGFIRDWDVGGTYTDTIPCPACHGARLRPEYLAVTLKGYNIHDLSLMSLKDLRRVADALDPPRKASRLAEASLSTIRRRLKFLEQVGLGYLHLDRIAGSLSAGEVQRIRLAGLLGSGLTSLTLLLDEPTRGLHPVEVEALLEALRGLRDEGNTVVIVEHDPGVIAAADHLIDMGPGAGQEGGQVVAQGTPEEITRAGSLTGLWLKGERLAAIPIHRRQPHGWLTVRGARANNLRGETVAIPLGALVGMCGVSGSGKSTLVMDTIGRSLAPRKQTTSVAYEPVDPGEHDSIEGAPERVMLVDQSRAGLRSPAAFLELEKPLRKIFALSEDARALGLDETRLGRGCSACNGSGVTYLEMGFLPDVRLPCEVCQGSGYLSEAWQVRLHGLALPEVFSRTLDEVYDLFGEDPALGGPLEAARKVGLGYLVLRQPSYALSGGEAQRLKIVQELWRKRSTGTLYLLDEPSLGQHLEDVRRLVGVLGGLVEAGASVLVVEHHPHILAACDWLLELGPGGGPDGGSLIASGTPEQLSAGITPTSPYLRTVLAQGGAR
jgi:excinuclease ABC subunit A